MRKEAGSHEMENDMQIREPQPLFRGQSGMNLVNPIHRALLKSVTLSEAGLRGIMRAEQDWMSAMLRLTAVKSYEPLLHVACKKSRNNKNREVAVYSMYGVCPETRSSEMEECGKACAKMRIVPEAIMFSAEGTVKDHDAIVLFAHNFSGTIKAMAVMEIDRLNGVIIPGVWEYFVVDGGTDEILHDFWRGYAGEMN